MFPMRAVPMLADTGHMTEFEMLARFLSQAADLSDVPIACCHSPNVNVWNLRARFLSDAGVCEQLDCSWFEAMPC